MVEVIHLGPNEPMPDLGDRQRWITIEASRDGQFFGTGSSWKANGEWVGYASLAEHDASFEKAMAAAQAWGEKYDVPTIWVQLTP